MITVLLVGGAVSTKASAKTSNYGSIARSDTYDGVYIHFRFDKKRTQKYNVTPNGDFRFRVVYDTKIKNSTKHPVRFYFSKLYFADKSDDPTFSFKVVRPHRFVVVKAHHTKVINNSFRDESNPQSSIYLPSKTSQSVIQYYKNNKYYLGAVNTMHHASKGYGWHPTWTWSK